MTGNRRETAFYGIPCIRSNHLGTLVLYGECGPENRFRGEGLGYGQGYAAGGSPRAT